MGKPAPALQKLMLKRLEREKQTQIKKVKTFTKQALTLEAAAGKPTKKSKALKNKATIAEKEAIKLGRAKRSARNVLGPIKKK